MKIPLHIAADVSEGRRLGFACRLDGAVIGGFEAGWGDSCERATSPP